MGRWHDLRCLIRACALWLVMGLWGVQAHAAEVQSIRLGEHEAAYRLVIEGSAPFRYTLFTLNNPARLVVDIPSGQWNVADIPELKAHPFIKDIRHGRPKAGVLRIVADVRHDLVEPNHFLLDAGNGRPFRLVVDMASGGAVAKKVEAPQQAAPAPKRTDVEVVTSAPIPVLKPEVPGSRSYIIMIDPGHGGVDPGAISRKGTREKEVTLEYAKALAARLNQTKGYQAILTRHNDRYLRLRERIAVARQKKANLFISLHADSAPNRRARGLSVYTLSETASDKEAAMLASRENKSDIIAGMDLSNKSADVANILIDLAQRETKNKSSIFAELLIKELGSRVHLVKNSHRFAGFAVLKAPDIPSVLVELGFLSNRDDEKLLRSGAYRDKLVKSLAQAVRRYFDEMEGKP
jgi:N-acetylmuramoyl-L-alanine amidase